MIWDALYFLDRIISFKARRLGSYRKGRFLEEISWRVIRSGVLLGKCQKRPVFGRGGKRFIKIPLFKSLERVDEVGLIVRERFYVRRE